MKTNLKYFREQLHLTQKQVAEYLSVSTPAYCNYENGLRDIPIEVLCKLANLFDTTLDQLIIGDENSNSPFARIIANNERLSKTFDVVISGNISQQAYDEIMNFVDYIKTKYGYPKS